MDINNQIQKAGDGSQQFQIGNVTINNGVSEECAKNIFSVLTQLTHEQLAEIARYVADERIGQFEKSLMPRIQQIENALRFFAEPAFQFLLHQAQLSAAATDQEEDYKLLTELLVCHIQKYIN